MALDTNATFTWFGHSCWEVRTPGGKTVIFDPWYSNPSSPKRPVTLTVHRAFSFLMRRACS